MVADKDNAVVKIDVQGEAADAHRKSLSPAEQDCTARMKKHFESHHNKANFICLIFIVFLVTGGGVLFGVRERLFNIYKDPTLIANFELLIMAVRYYKWIEADMTNTDYMQKGPYGSCMTRATLYELWTYMERAPCERTFEDDDDKYIDDDGVFGKKLYRTSTVGPRCTADNITENPGQFAMFACLWDQGLKTITEDDDQTQKLIDSLALPLPRDVGFNFNKTDYTQVCDSASMKKIYSGVGSDTVYCGPNSYNDQACLAGLMRPFDADLKTVSYRAPDPCPAGFWCPKNFVCAVPCPYGAYCPMTRMNSDGNLCVTPLHAFKSVAPFESYNFSQTFVNNDLLGPTSKDDLTTWAQANYEHTQCTTGDNFLRCHHKICPGTGRVPLCPEGYYCPNPTEAIVCKSGHYCPAGSYEMTKCAIKSGCHKAGLPYPKIDAVLVEAYVGLLFGLTLIFYILLKIRQHFRMLRREKQEQIIAARNEAREAGTLQVDQAFMELTYCGCGTLGHIFLGTLSFFLFVAGIALIGADRNSEGELIGIILVAIGGPLLLVATIGLWNIRKKEHWEEEQQTRTKKATTELTPKPTRQASTKIDRESMTNRIQSTERLGSIEDKKKAKTLINIEVDNLGLTLNSNGAVVLAGVSGRLNAGSVTAIMGPSGAGKTTFLNTLSARATYGATTGRILINEEENTIESISNLVGFVPQDDVMHRELTVREILKTYARLRLPKRFIASEVERIVEDVIEALGLGHIVDSEIGDETKRGISGGQRKRVNVGMEMVADPSLLFLDEPTSGLDSTTSFDLIDALRILADKGVNVMAVLHQPSFELYQKFTNVLLLGRGGKTVYLGKSDQALQYFTQLRFVKPDMMNPADFFMDVIAGKFSRTNADDNPKLQADGEATQKYFDAYRHKKMRKAVDDGKHATDMNAMEEQIRRLESLSMDELRTGLTDAEQLELRRIELFDLWLMYKEPYTERAMEGFLKAAPIHGSVYEKTEFAGPLLSILMFTKRAFNQLLRTPGDMYADIILMTVVGFVLGKAYGVISLSSAASTFLIFSLGLGMMTGILSLRTFGNERVVFWREAAAGAGMGLNPLYYFIAKNIVEVPRLFILTSIMSICFYPMVQPLCNIGSFFLYSFVLGFYMSGWAQLVSICFAKSQAQLVIVMLSLIFMLYAGVRQPLDGMGGMTYAISWLSPNRWMIENFFLCHTHELSAAYRLPPSWYDQASNGALVANLASLSYNEVMMYATESPAKIRYRATVANALWQTFDFTPCTILKQSHDDPENDYFAQDDYELEYNGDCSKGYLVMNATSYQKVTLFSGGQLKFAQNDYGLGYNYSTYLKTPHPIPNFDWNTLVSITMGLLLRVAAFIALLLNDREKMGKPSYANLFFYKAMYPVYDLIESELRPLVDKLLGRNKEPEMGTTEKDEVIRGTLNRGTDSTMMPEPAPAGATHNPLSSSVSP